MDHLVSEFVVHYHEARPHQGLESELPPRQGEPESGIGDAGASTLCMADIECSESLGGVLRHYSRAA